MRVSADWYYDVISPYAYLQTASLPGLAALMDITPRPILFAGVLRHWGQLGPAEIAPKRVFTYRHCLALAGARGLPFVMPPQHPFNPLPALRLLMAMDADLATVARALAFVFGAGNPVDHDDAAGLADWLGASAEQRALARSAIVKDGLRAATEAATAAGVFGVPTFVVDGEHFWGNDSEGMLRDYLRDPGCFQRGEMARAATLPPGAQRG